jgi:phasin family protein
MTNADQFSTATKASIESQLSTMNEFANKAFQSVAELVELNISTAKASLEHASAAAHQLMAAKDPQEIMAMAQSQAQPNAEKALAYGKHLASITAKAQADFTKAAEIRMAETSRHVSTLIDDLTKSAPAGSEKAIEMLKATIAGAHTGYEQMTKATKQATEKMEEQINEAVKHFAPATEKPSRAKK